MNTEKKYREPAVIDRQIERAISYVKDEQSRLEGKSVYRNTLCNQINWLKLTKELQSEIIKLLCQSDEGVALMRESFTRDIAKHELADDEFDNYNNKSSQTDSEITKGKYYNHQFMIRLDDLLDNNAVNKNVYSVIKSISKWYDVRFINYRKDPSGFIFNPDKIPGYIDDLIVTFGKAIHEDTFGVIELNLNHWLDSLYSIGSKYALPYKFLPSRQGKFDKICTKEAVCLEYLIKSKLYDDNFSPPSASKTSVLEAYQRVNGHVEPLDILTELGWN